MQANETSEKELLYSYFTENVISNVKKKYQNEDDFDDDFEDEDDLFDKEPDEADLIDDDLFDEDDEYPL